MMGAPDGPQSSDISNLSVVLAFQISGRLNSDQASGQACAWCGRALAQGAGTSLGGDRGWRPHACPDCFEARSEWLQAYFAWARHHDDCTSACGRGRQCEIRNSFEDRVAEAGRRAGRGVPRCVRCRRVLKAKGLFRPEPWDGNTGPVYSFVHILTADCTA